MVGTEELLNWEPLTPVTPMDRWWAGVERRKAERVERERGEWSRESRLARAKELADLVRNAVR